MGGGNPTTTTTQEASPYTGQFSNLLNQVWGSGQPLVNEASSQFSQLIAGNPNAAMAGPTYSSVQQGTGQNLNWINQNVAPGGEQDYLASQAVQSGNTNMTNAINQNMALGLQGAGSMGTELESGALGGFSALSYPGGTSTSTTTGGGKFG